MKIKNVQAGKLSTNEVINMEASKSAKMVNLFNMGLEVKQIATMLNVRYNFVFNVISNYVRVNDLEVITTERNSVKGDIINLYNEGKTNIQISQQLKVNYNYVFKVIKEYKASL